MLPNDPFDTADERNLYYRQLRDRLISRPGVSVVAASTLPPLTSGAPVAVDTGPADSPSAPRISAQDVTPTFFAGLEIPLVAGRVFDARDTAAAAPVIVVNARAAQQIFGRPSAAVGQRVRLDSGPWREIVGVVGNVRSSFFNTLEWRTDPIVYRPAAQSFVSVTPSAASFGFFLHVRSERALTMADIRDTAHAVSARAAVTEVQRVSDLVGVATRQPALRMALLSGVAVAGLLLAAIGVYGIVSQAVGRRLREIAVRIALGAAPVRVVATMTVGALVTGVAGLAVGILLALVLSRTFEALLYGVGSRDLVSFVVSGMALLIVTVVAALIPAWRAARVDPMRVLRAE
jgi:hypothetical protein